VRALSFACPWPNGRGTKSKATCLVCHMPPEQLCILQGFFAAKAQSPQETNLLGGIEIIV